jgi:hypothetical protein
VAHYPSLQYFQSPDSQSSFENLVFKRVALRAALRKCVSLVVVILHFIISSRTKNPGSFVSIILSLITARHALLYFHFIIYMVLNFLKYRHE